MKEGLLGHPRTRPRWTTQLGKFGLPLILILSACQNPDRLSPEYGPLVPSDFEGGQTTSSPEATPKPADNPPPDAEEEQRWRFGFGMALPLNADLWAEVLGAGWYLDWKVDDRDCNNPVEYWPMVRLSSEGGKPSPREAALLAEDNPGCTWVIGNEPDVIWQDNLPPEQYAEEYGRYYQAIKRGDPTALVAIAAVAQATPLRMAYLDRVLEAYQTRFGNPMPVDIWTLHGFILREERGSWGVDIPPGIEADAGLLFEVSDHTRIEILEEQLWVFRSWMAIHGYREKPLVVTEFGVLMPTEYGFPEEDVIAFMRSAFDLFLRLQDEGLGAPWDANRLVQRFAWYSLADSQYPAGNLVTLDTQELSNLGRAYQAYVQSR